MSILKTLLRSRMAWAILGMATAGYFAFLIAVLGIVASSPRNFIVLTLNEEGDLQSAGEQVLVTDEEVNGYLAGLFTKARRLTRTGRPDDVKTLAVLTAPDAVPFKLVWRIMHATRRAGFTRIDLRRQEVDETPEGPPLPEGDEPTDEPELELPVLPTDVLLHLRSGGLLGKDGELTGIIVATAEGEVAIPDLDALRKFLRKKREEGLFVREIRVLAEGELFYGHLIDAVRQCQKAGFKRVRYLPPPDWTPPEDAPRY
jgi:biopolymer transport protein ExbD